MPDCSRTRCLLLLVPLVVEYTLCALDYSETTQEAHIFNFCLGAPGCHGEMLDRKKVFVGPCSSQGYIPQSNFALFIYLKPKTRNIAQATAVQCTYVCTQVLAEK